MKSLFISMSTFCFFRSLFHTNTHTYTSSHLHFYNEKLHDIFEYGCVTSLFLKQLNLQLPNSAERHTHSGNSIALYNNCISLHISGVIQRGLVTVDELKFECYDSLTTGNLLHMQTLHLKLVYFGLESMNRAFNF